MLTQSLVLAIAAPPFASLSEEAIRYPDFIQKVLACIAIVLGGMWAYWLFRLQRTSATNLQVTVLPQVIRVQGGESDRLLRVNITLKNIGKVRSKPGPSGCTFRVWKLEQKRQKSGMLVEWDRPGQYPRDPIGAQRIVGPLDVFRPYKKGQGGKRLYEFEPGVEYHEVEALFVTQGDLLLIEVGLAVETDEDGVTEYSLVSIE
jgi:hypothetical protein